MSGKYQTEGLKDIACKIALGYRRDEVIRFTSADIIGDVMAHPDYEVLRKHNPKLEIAGVRGAVLSAVVSSLKFSSGPWAGDQCLLYVPVVGRKLHDLMFADDLTDNDWAARETKQGQRLARLQGRLADVNATRRELQQHGADATMATIHGRMAVGY